LNENIKNMTKSIKVGYFSMGISSVLAGILLIIHQLDYKIIGGIYILWPVMMILLGLETIITKFIASVSKNHSTLKPAWGILIICIALIGFSQIWLMLMDTSYYINW